MRRTAIATGTGLLVLALGAGPVTADTVTAPADVYVAGGLIEIVEHGQVFSGYIQVEDDRLTGTKHASVYLAASGDERVCDGGTPEDPADDYTANDYIEWSGESITILDASTRSDLAASKFELAALGPYGTYDACTGERIASHTEHHRFTVALKATSDLVSETNEVLLDNGDGTVSQGLETYSYRTAAGKASVDGLDAVLSDALIQHALIVRL